MKQYNKKFKLSPKLKPKPKPTHIKLEDIIDDMHFMQFINNKYPNKKY